MNRVADRLAIQELVARYSYYVDTSQVDRCVSLWAEDAVFDESAAGTGCHEGRTALRKFFTTICSVAEWQVHHGGPHLIEFTSETEATGIQYSFVPAKPHGGKEVRNHIYYEDKYIKVGECWLFKRRVIVPLSPIDSGDFSQHVSSVK